MSEAKQLSQITCTFSNYLFVAKVLKSLIPDSHGQMAADNVQRHLSSKKTHQELRSKAMNAWREAAIVA
jgi:hypothetical protein